MCSVLKLDGRTIFFVQFFLHSSCSYHIILYTLHNIMVSHCVIFTRDNPPQDPSRSSWHCNVAIMTMKHPCPFGLSCLVFFSQLTSLFAARKDHVTRDRRDIEHDERHNGAHRHPFGWAASPWEQRNWRGPQHGHHSSSKESTVWHQARTFPNDAGHGAWFPPSHQAKRNQQRPTHAHADTRPTHSTTERPSIAARHAAPTHPISWGLSLTLLIWICGRGTFLIRWVILDWCSKGYEDSSLVKCGRWMCLICWWTHQKASCHQRKQTVALLRLQATSSLNQLRIRARSLSIFWRIYGVQLCWQRPVMICTLANISGTTPQFISSINNNNGIRKWH